MESKRIEKFGKAEAEAYKTIAAYKWSDAFVCVKCGHIRYFEGKYPYSRRCLKCKKDHSATEGTVFHGVRFPLHIALYIVKEVATTKEKLTVERVTKEAMTVLNRSIRHKTVWAFLIKVYSAIPLYNMKFENKVTLERFKYGNGNILAVTGWFNFEQRHGAIFSNDNSIIDDLTGKI